VGRRVVTIVIRGKLLIDGTGGDPVPDPVIVVEDDTIEAVGVAGQIEVGPDASVVDLSGMTLLPGLIDAHIHLEGWRSMDLMDWMTTPLALSALRATVDARRLLEAGFTAVRCLGGGASVYLRQAIEEGIVQGPRIVTSGRSFIQTSGGADPWNVPIECMEVLARLGQTLADTVDGPEECRSGVRRRLREGADCIKILTTGAVHSEHNPPTQVGFTQEETDALVDEAHRLGLKIAAHAHGTAGILTALRAGVDTIEHGSCLDQECIELMLERDIYLVPTFSVIRCNLDPGEDGLPDTEYGLRQGREIQETHRRSFVQAYEAGVKIAAGTDFIGVPPMKHGSNAIELECLVEAGMAPMEAIVAATGDGADAIGLGEKTGTVVAGKWADIVAVERNPLDRITALRDVAFVMKAGEVIKNRAARVCE
jgi:imidazolonepropionase-like amidohydrolase